MAAEPVPSEVWGSGLVVAWLAQQLIWEVLCLAVGRARQQVRARWIRSQDAEPVATQSVLGLTLPAELMRSRERARSNTPFQPPRLREALEHIRRQAEEQNPLRHLDGMDLQHLLDSQRLLGGRPHWAGPVIDPAVIEAAMPESTRRLQETRARLLPLLEMQGLMSPSPYARLSEARAALAEMDRSQGLWR